MKKRLWVVGIIAVLIVGVGFYGVYQYGGLKYYLKAVKAINQLEGDEKERARKLFNGSPNESFEVYGGILIGLNQKDNGGVWVWGSKGPKYFRSDEFSVYSFYKICKSAIIEKYKRGEEVNVGRSIDTDIKTWADKVSQGDYVAIIVTSKGHEGALGNLREALAHDWWAFSNVDVEEQCE